MNARKPSKKAAPKKAVARKSAPRKKTPAKAKPAAPKAAARAAKARPQALPRLLVQVVRALDAKKADQVQVLDVAELSSITDYLVLANATSEPHLRALRIELEKAIDAEQAKILGIDRGQGSGWMVIDAFDVMVHLFTPENREKYRLDLLWRDARSVDVSGLV